MLYFSNHLHLIRSWTERIDLLERKDQYEEALNLAQSFYDGRAKAVSGLALGATKRMQVGMSLV